MALELLRLDPKLAITPDDDGETFVKILATMPHLFPSGRQLPFFQQWIYHWINIEDTIMVNEVSIEVPNSNTRASDGNINLIHEI